MIRDERGLSLPELLLVLAIMGLITAFLATAIYQIVDITNRGNSELAVQHDLRNAAVWLNRDVLSASKAVITQEGDDYQMVLEVPYLRTTLEVTTTIRPITYTYSEETGNLTRDSDGSSQIIARHIASNPFPLDTDIEASNVITAPNVITVTLYSLEGNVLGSGKFALKMRAGGSIATMRLCQVTGAENLGFAGAKVTWVITNNGDTSPSIDEIYIAWPGTDEIKLALINFDTNSIWFGGQYPPSATISGPWLGGFESREIYSGTHTLEFNFASAPISDELQYSITITLTDNSTVPFPPNP